MFTRLTSLFFVGLFALSLLAAACGSGGDSGSNGVSIAPSAASPEATPVPPTATPPPPTPTPVIVRRDIFADHLVIPSLKIDSRVQPSQTIPYVDSPLPGCPADTDSTETLVVPTSGIATPAKGEEGLENKAWIFGHSRYLGAPQTFFALQNINIGDEVIVDGTDRQTNARLTNQRFIINRIYVTDTDSGGKLLGADDISQMPHMPQVILQTSVRESGPGKQWILDRDRLTAKAKVQVEGDINDPCKYLLMFAFGDLVPQ
jgi:hypothetical protein